MRQFIRICLYLILLHCAVTSGNESSASDESSASEEGTCQYPEEYLSKEWFYAYNGYRPGEDIRTQVFSEVSRTVNSTDEYVCVDSEKEENTVYTVSSISVDGQLQYQCTENNFLYDDLILQRESGLMSSQPTTEQCEENIQQDVWFRVLPPYLEKDGGFYIPQMDCPFPQGTFHLTLSRYGIPGYCKDTDFLDSTGVVNGTRFTVRICDEYYSLVYFFVCHHRILATDLGEPDSSNGDLLITSRIYPYPPYSAFYCFRYKVEEGGNKFHVSSVFREGTEIECPKGYTYSEYGPIPDEAGYPFLFMMEDEDTYGHP